MPNQISIYQQIIIYFDKEKDIYIDLIKDHIKDFKIFKILLFNEEKEYYNNITEIYTDEDYEYNLIKNSFFIIYLSIFLRFRCLQF